MCTPNAFFVLFVLLAVPLHSARGDRLSISASERHHGWVMWSSSAVARLWSGREPLLPISVLKVRSIRYHVKIPQITYTQAATYIWIVASLAVAVGGFLSCTESSMSISLICDKEQCVFERLRGRSREPLERITISRPDFLSAYTTRTRNGEPVDFDVVRRRKQRVLGHSFVFRYRVPVGSGTWDGTYEERSVLFAMHNIGRKRARRQVTAVNAYIQGEVDEVDVQEVKAWSTFGVLILVFGLMFACFGAVLGDLIGSEEEEISRKII